MDQLQVLGKQKIGNFEFVAIEGGFGEGKKAMAVKDIAEIHEKEAKVINQAINMNHSRFIEGVDIIDILGVNQIDPKDFGYTQQAINSYLGLKNKGLNAGIYLLSERGYAKLLKILEDDTAWEIYDGLVDNYFSMRQQTTSLPKNNTELLLETALKHERDIVEVTNRIEKLETETCINSSQRRKIQGQVMSTVIKELGGKKSNAYKNPSINRTAFSNCYSQIKKVFDVASYADIPKVRFEEAMKLIPKWRPSLELQNRISESNGIGYLWEEGDGG